MEKKTVAKFTKGQIVYNNLTEQDGVIADYPNWNGLTWMYSFKGQDIRCGEGYLSAYKSDKQNSILETAALLWWKSLGERERVSLTASYYGLLPNEISTQDTVDIYNGEHPNKALLESPTDNLNKEGGEPMSKEDWIKAFKDLNVDFIKIATIANDLKADNLKLLSDVKVLREALQNMIFIADIYKSERRTTKLFDDNLSEAKSALEQTKQ